MPSLSNETERTVQGLQLEQFLPYRLVVVADKVSQSLAKLYSARYGIGIPEWRVVATLGQFDTMTAKDIGHHSHMHKTKVSRAVAALEKRGLIARTPDSQDRRAAFLRLTDKGRALYSDIAPDALTFARALEAELSAEDHVALERILTRLLAKSEALARAIKPDGRARGRQS